VLTGSAFSRISREKFPYVESVAEPTALTILPDFPIFPFPSFLLLAGSLFAFAVSNDFWLEAAVFVSVSRKQRVPALKCNAMTVPKRARQTEQKTGYAFSFLKHIEVHGSIFKIFI